MCAAARLRVTYLASELLRSLTRSRSWGDLDWGRNIEEVKSMRRAMTIVSCVLVSLVLTANIALADACENVSRPAPAPGTDTVRGNWIWLPSLGIPGLPAAWGFAVPGGWASTTFSFPGANGNYTNGEAHALLGMSANCDPLKETSRQSTNGIQTGGCP